MFRFVAAIYLIMVSTAFAGRHDQSTHSTPKGYHHDGTPHFEGELFVALALFFGVFVWLLLLASRQIVSSTRQLYNLNQQCIFAQNSKLTTGFRADFVALAARFTSSSRHYASIISIHTSNFYKKAMAVEAVPPILIGLIVSVPGVAFVVWFFNRR